MKKILLFLLLLCSFRGAQAAPQRSMETDIAGITFRIDKRIELFHTVAYLAGYPFLNGLELDYKSRLEEHFAPYRRHEAVEQFREVFSGLFGSIDAPIFYMLSLNEELDFVTEPQYVQDRQEAERFRLMLRSFAAESDFDGFYRNNSDLYRIILATIEFNFADFATRGMLEEYYGTLDNKEFVIVLNLLGSGNFGPLIATPQGTTGYCVIESVQTLGHIPGFPPGRMLDGLVFHEFSHTYITPLVERNEALIRESAHLLDPIRESMQSQGYDNWTTVVNEHITRAAACRLAARKYGEESARLTEYRLEAARRFIYVEPLAEKLAEYERNRSTYRNFDDFFPELLSVFAQITAEDIDRYQKGTEESRTPSADKIPTFSEALEADPGELVIVLPTAERGEGARELEEFVREYHRNYFPQAELLTDAEALVRDLSDRNLVVFGTPWGNLFLKEHIHRLPVSVREDRIIAGKEYRGTDYQLLTGWVNPLNPERKMSVYTAQRPENIVRINTIMPADGFTIARNYQTLRWGEYIRAWQSWVVRD